MGAYACSFDRWGVAGKLPAAGTVAGSIGEHKGNSGQKQPRPWGWPRADRGQCCAPATTVASATGRPWPVLLHQPRPWHPPRADRGTSHGQTVAGATTVGASVRSDFLLRFLLFHSSCTLLLIPKHPCSVIFVPRSLIMAMLMFVR